VLVDTAGLREAGDDIEIEGIRRSRATLATAELILQVFDATEPQTPADRNYLAEFAGKNRILVRNKVDLPGRLELPAAGTAPVIDVSCVTGEGLERLKDSIKESIWSGEIKAEMLQVMINSRHQDALKRALKALQQSLQALRAGETLELVALDLRIAVSAVGEIVGQTSTEDLLDSIFSQFCIGK
jgi:tRNA modification GTPase